MLMAGARPLSPQADRSAAFTQTMRDLGYVEGRNIHYEWRFAEGNLSPERLDALVSQLLQASVDVIVTPTTASALAARRATATIPIVFSHAADPVGSGLVPSLARPGGNMTGVSMMQGEIGGKQLELLRRVVPTVSRVGLLTNPTNAGNRPTVDQIQRAGQKTGLQIVYMEARSPQEIERAFVTLSQRGAQALVITPDAFFLQQRRQFAELAAAHRLPAIHGVGEFVEAGGLMSYGLNLTENWRRAAGYVERILRGAKPGDLAVEQPTKLELVINPKAAKALGVRFPQDVLAVVDRVID